MQFWTDKLKLGKGSGFVKRELRLLPLTDAEYEADFWFDAASSTKRRELWMGMVIERELDSLRTIATFRHDDQEVHRLVGPAMWKKEGWRLPVSSLFHDADVGLPSHRKQSHSLIESHGLGPRTSLKT